MALEMNFWEADGKAETLHHTIRLGKSEEYEQHLQEFKSAMCQGTIVRVTLDRSDKQSPISRDLWIKPGYKDPFAD